MVLSSPSPSFLNGSIRNLNYLRARIFGFLIKDFRHDERGVTPECLCQGSTVFKSMDA